MYEQQKQAILDRFSICGPETVGDVQRALDKVRSERVLDYMDSSDYRLSPALRRDVNDLLFSDPDDRQLERILECDERRTGVLKETREVPLGWQIESGPTTGGGEVESVDTYTPKYPYHERKAARAELEELKKHPDEKVRKLAARFLNRPRNNVIKDDDWNGWKKENPVKVFVGGSVLGVSLAAPFVYLAYRAIVNF